MKNKVLSIGLVLFFALTITFSGCIGQPKKDEKPSFGSSDGLSIEFVPGAPPTSVGEDDVFDLSVKLNNKGEHDIPEGEAAVFILGVNPRSIQGLNEDDETDAGWTAFGTGDTDKDGVQDKYEDYREWNAGYDGNPLVRVYKGTCSDAQYTTKIDCENAGEIWTSATLYGVHFLNDEIIPGTVDYLEWPVLEYGVDISSDQKLNWVAQACYRYETDAWATACFNENPFSQTTGAETCKIQGTKEVTNSGAPVKVTEIRENPAGRNKFTFTFTIENLGSGTVYDPRRNEGNHDITECTSLKTQNLNQVRIKSVKIGNILQTCGNKLSYTAGEEKYPVIRLVDGKGQFTCTTTVDDSLIGDYTDLVSINLDYGYYQQIKTSTTIKNILEIGGEEEEESSGTE